MTRRPYELTETEWEIIQQAFSNNAFANSLHPLRNSTKCVSMAK